MKNKWIYKTSFNFTFDDPEPAKCGDCGKKALRGIRTPYCPFCGLKKINPEERFLETKGE